MQHLRKSHTVVVLVALLLGTFAAMPARTYAGTQGCTPGYWKQAQHFDSWAHYTPSDTLSPTFTNAGNFGGSTLLEALNFRGGNTLNGAQQILFRAATAAVLNAAVEKYVGRDTLNYPGPADRTIQNIDSQVNAAITSGDRATILNLASKLDIINNLGCPLN